METGASDALPDITALQQKLRRLLGMRLEEVTDPEDFGCLRELPLVHDRVTRHYEKVEVWRKAVEEAILDGAYSLDDAQNLLIGRKKRVKVNADRLAQAIISSFNLRHETRLDTAKKRRAKAKSTLLLDCDARTYCAEGNIPCPELDLMRILAKQLVKLTTTGARGYTEKIELTLFMEENDCTHYVYGSFYWDHRVAVRHIDIARTMKQSSSESTWILEQGELEDAWYPGFGSRYVPTSGISQIRMTSCPDEGMVIVRFPKSEYGKSRTLGYRRIFQPQQPLENVILIRPTEAYDTLTLRVIFSNAPKPASVLAFREREKPPRYHYADSAMTEISPLQDGSYCLTFPRPSPNFYLGFMLLFDDHPGGQHPLAHHQSKSKPYSTEQEKESKPHIEPGKSDTTERPYRRRPSRRGKRTSTSDPEN